MKLRDFLTKILPATVFKQEGLAAVLSASALDIDMPDEVESAFNDHYMTSERAANDPKVSKALKDKHWAHFAYTVERDLAKALNSLPEEYRSKYEAIPENKANGLYDRLAVFNEGVSHLAEKGAGEDVKQVTEKHRKLEKELRDQNAALAKSLEDEKKNGAELVTKEKLNYALRSKVEGWIPKLDPNLFKLDAQKNFLVDSTINNLFAGYKLEFNKDNQSEIMFLTKDGGDVYEGNTKVSLEKHIEKQMEPYTVKNNGGTPPAPAKGTTRTIETTAPVGKDLKSRMIAAAP